VFMTFDSKKLKLKTGSTWPWPYRDRLHLTLTLQRLAPFNLDLTETGFTWPWPSMLLLVTELSFYVHLMMALLKLFWPETVLLFWFCPVLRANQCISRRQCTVVTAKTTAWLSSIWPWPYRDWLSLTLTL